MDNTELENRFDRIEARFDIIEKLLHEEYFNAEQISIILDRVEKNLATLHDSIIRLMNRVADLKAQIH